jgi:hypothetical protein
MLNVMDYLIAPTLFLNRTCRLPGIGTLSVVTSAAESDFHNSQIKAPVPSILFSASKDDENVFNEFTALSELIKKDLDEKRSVNLKGVGDFIKNEDGLISFVPIHLSLRFTPPVHVEIVNRQHLEHAMLVGDKETTNIEMTQYFVEEEKTTLAWWVWAIILGIVGIAILVYYFSRQGFNLLGNNMGL